MVYLLSPFLGDREALIAHLKSIRIPSPFHYQPLHLSAKGKEYGGKEGVCPVTEDVSARLCSFPLYNDLADAELDRVVD